MVNNGLFDYGGNTGSFPSGNFTINGGTLAFGTLTKTMGAGSVFTLAGGTISGSGTLTGASAYQLQGRHGQHQPRRQRRREQDGAGHGHAC